MSIVDVIRSGNEPEQGLKPRSQITARELLREVGSVLRMSEADFTSVIDATLTAAFRVCKRASQGMLRARRGRIVLMSSVVGLMGNAGQVNYAAAKAGLIGMTKSLAQELASRNITVNCVAPGLLEGTRATANLRPEAVENPFFLMAPPQLQWPLVLLSTAATVIASQAVISGAYSVARQAMQLGLLPRMRVIQTSVKVRGQIFIPAITVVQFAAVIATVLIFQSSAHLAAAYGFAVTGTFCCTTIFGISKISRIWN